MSTLEIRHFEIVQAIGETGSVARAAERLHLSAPALSHALKALEDRVGAALFTRGRRMTPTAAGELLLAAGREVLALTRKAEDALQHTWAEHVETVRVATECYTSYHWLTEVARTLRAQAPHIALEIAPDAAARPEDALLDGSLDLAVVHSKPLGRRIACVPLFQDELLLIVPTGHPLAARRRRSVTPDDLASETVLTHQGLERSTLWKGFLAPAGVRPKRILTVRVTDALVESVRAGLGVSAVARWIAAPHIGSGHVHGLRLGPHGVRRQWYAATLRLGSKPAASTLLAVIAAAAARQRARSPRQEAGGRRPA